MKSLNIAVVGFTMAGKTTIVSNLLQMYGCKKTRYGLIHHEAVHEIEYGGKRIIFKICNAREKSFHSGKSLDELNERVQNELCWIKSSNGLFFVIDAQRPCHDLNLRSFETLKEDLMLMDITVDDIPVIFLINKTDLKNTFSVDELKNSFSAKNCDYVETVGTKGVGFEELIKKLLETLS